MTGAPAADLAALVDSRARIVEDFPRPGVAFRDISPLLADGPVLAAVVSEIAERFAGRVDAVAGIEARGFILAAPIAVHLGVGLIAVRKASKLPPPVLAKHYALEYGTATIELSPDAVEEGSRVLVVDDVLATGGTAAAACSLLAAAGASVAAVAVLIEIGELGGRFALAPHEVVALLAA